MSTTGSLLLGPRMLLCGFWVPHAQPPAAVGSSLMKPPAPRQCPRAQPPTHPCPRTPALVGRVGGQGVPKEAVLAAVAVEAGCVVDALEALACVAVAVPHSVRIDVVIALAQAARPHSAVLTKWVPEIGIITQLASFAWGRTEAHVLQQRAHCRSLTWPPSAAPPRSTLLSFFPFSPCEGTRKVHKTTQESLSISKFNPFSLELRIMNYFSFPLPSYHLKPYLLSFVVN